MESRPLRIALLGTRGIPARYGGFETFAEEISKRFIERGHSVTVYCRRKFFESSPELVEYEGVKLKYTPTIMHKYLETPLHSLTSFLSLWRQPYDVVLLCNAANSPFAWIGRLFGFPLAINVDGIERMRSKWNSLGKLWYRIGERSSVWFANKIVSDANVIADYYREYYNVESEVIAYGAEAEHVAPGEVLQKFQLSPGKYILYVSRLEPENNALGVIEAYNKIDTDVPLVIVGDAPYAAQYIEELHRVAGDNVIFTGYQFGEAYKEFRSHCMLYVQATEVGGTHPALIEAMAYGNCTIANGTPENREVLGDAGRFYDKNNFDQLAELFTELLTDEEQRSSLAKAAVDRAAKLYNWELVTEQYERLFRALCFEDKV